MKVGEVVVGSGSGHTHAGLLFGLRVLGYPARVTGVCVRRSKREQGERIRDLCSRIAGLLGVTSPVGARDIYLIDEFVAPGYGLLNPPTVESIKLAVINEGRLERMIFFAEDSLRKAIREFAEHYHAAITKDSAFG